MTELDTKQAPYLLRNPTLSGKHVAFGYAGNIWIVNRDGGQIRRLTSVGQEGRPVLSPDGRHIAFIGEYGGPRGVFVMSVAGGEPRRVTHHPDDLASVDFLVAGGGDWLGWRPDGKHILFSSRRAAFAGRPLTMAQLFTVPLQGGAPTPLPLIRAAEGSFSPDAARVAYVPHYQSQPGWKRYRGGQTSAIRIANLSDSSVEAQIPGNNSNDFSPMWVGDVIYFLSDRAGPVTLFSYDVTSQQVRQIVPNDGFDIKSAAACYGEIIYDQFGSLHLLDLRSGDDRVLDIRPVADFPEIRPHFKSLADIVGSNRAYPSITPRLSPTGAHAVFGVRGEILTVSANGGDIRNLTRTAAVVERDPAWSPDGKSIAYFSDESGEYALHIRQQSGFGAVRKIHLGEPPSFYYSPTWSPDSRKIAYTDKRLSHWYVDLEQGVPVRVDTGPYVDYSFYSQDLGPGCRLPIVWSPDSRWIAYVKALDSHRHALFVYSVDQDRSDALTDGMSDVVHVAFDQAGEYLYFTASTDAGLAGEVTMLCIDRPVRRSVYALLLNKTVVSPLAPRGDDETASTVAREPEAAKRKVTRIDIDLEDIARRIVRLPVPASNYSRLFAGPPGVLFLVEVPIEGPSTAQSQQVHRVDLAARKTERILEDVTYFNMSFSGNKMLYAKPYDNGKRRWLVASTHNPADSSTLELGSMEVYVDPRIEWRHMFEQVWRVQRDFLYDPGLHGLDLEETRKKYRPFLENIASCDDLYYLFGEMLANLSISHLIAYPMELFSRKFFRPQGARTGLLGADYSVAHDRYRFARIYESDPWNPATRSPLTEPGRSVEVGEYLLAVDGRDVRPSAEVFSYFENAVAKQVVLTVAQEPDGTGSRQVTVTPIDDEVPLRYFDWIERNRRRVDELSGGRVAYVHLPDCKSDGYASLNRYFFAQVGKDAAVIDVRYNIGGYVPDYVIDCLKRRPALYAHTREGRDVAEPGLVISGPKVMLSNEMAGSAGDLLPWMFRQAEVGPVVGKRTWGGVVGNFVFAFDLLDHGVLTNPHVALYGPEGGWIAENCGVSPDIEVEEDPKAARAGRDVQLERAVEVVMDLLERQPPASPPQHPPYPRYHGET